MEHSKNSRNSRNNSEQISLTQFCKEYGLAKTTVHNRCKKLGIETKDGLTSVAVETLLAEFNLSVVDGVLVEEIEAQAVNGWGLEVSTTNYNESLTTQKKDFSRMQRNIEGLDNNTQQALYDLVSDVQQYAEDKVDEIYLKIDGAAAAIANQAIGSAVQKRRQRKGK